MRANEKRIRVEISIVTRTDAIPEDFHRGQRADDANFNPRDLNGGTQ